jgi:hypothetical protein
MMKFTETSTMAAFLMVRRWQAMKVATRAIINVEEEFRVLTRNLQETLDLQDEKLQNLEVCISCAIPFPENILKFQTSFHLLCEQAHFLKL